MTRIRLAAVAMVAVLTLAVPRGVLGQPPATEPDPAILAGALQYFLQSSRGMFAVTPEATATLTSGRSGEPSVALHHQATLDAFLREGAGRVRIGPLTDFRQGCSGYPQPCRLVGADAVLSLFPMSFTTDSASVSFSLFSRMPDSDTPRPNCCVGHSSGRLDLARRSDRWVVVRYVPAVSS